MGALDVDENRMKLPNKLNIRNIVSVHDGIIEQVLSSEAVSFDIPVDCEVDLSFVQLIEAARIQAKASGTSITLLSPAKGALLDVLNRGGFVESFSADDRKFWLHDGVTQ